MFSRLSQLLLCASVPSTFTLWHNRPGHPSFSIVKTVVSQCNVLISNKVDSSFCSAYCLGKIHRLPFPSTLHEYLAPLHLIHTDLWGPSPILSSSGYKYYIHFIDDYTKFTWIYLLKNKSEAFSTFCHCQTQVELHLGTKIKNIEHLLTFSKLMASITEFLVHGLINKMVQQKESIDTSLKPD